MRKCAAVILIVMVLFPVFAAAQGSGQKEDSLAVRLKHAHEMVRFWWSVYTSQKIPKYYRKLIQWTVECSRLMKEADKK